MMRLANPRKDGRGFEPRRPTREDQLNLARERLSNVIDQYIKTEAEVRALEQGTFRVVIFGSARIKPQDAIYQSIYRISQALAERAIDIVTGGGPGLMEAANSGIADVVERESRSYGLPILIPSLQEPINRHLDIKRSHRRFTSRLDEFMRLSNAVVVAPGGIGTMLELIYVWQLLQVGLVYDRPVILLGKDIWGGLLKWMRKILLEHDYISVKDFRWITLVDTEEEVIDLLIKAHERFKQAQIEKRQLGDEERERTVSAEVLGQMPTPTEVTEEGAA